MIKGIELYLFRGLKFLWPLLNEIHEGIEKCIVPVKTMVRRCGVWGKILQPHLILSWPTGT